MDNWIRTQLMIECLIYFFLPNGFGFDKKKTLKAKKKSGFCQVEFFFYLKKKKSKNLNLRNS